MTSLIFRTAVLQADCKIRLSLVFCFRDKRLEAAVETLKNYIEQQEIVR